MRSRLPSASWTRPESWHLTLRFLGDISASASEEFAERLAPAAAAFPESELAPAGPVLFPPRGRPRVIAVGLDAGTGVAALGEVARAAERAARSVGCPPEDRIFRPHVTLTRLRDRWPDAAVEKACDEIRAWPLPVWKVSSLVLYESRLDPAGAVHTPLHQWAAAPAPASVRA